jgi:uncharacterized protein YwgA
MAVEVLGGLLKRVGNFDPSRFASSFSERLILQKTIYLLQAGFGVKLGYGYSWYIHGPYSPALARDAFPLAKVYDSTVRVRFKDPEWETRFGRFLEFISPHARDESWLEIAASMLYLYRDGHDRDSILSTMQKKNSAFTRDRCLAIWQELQSWDIVPK